MSNKLPRREFLYLGAGLAAASATRSLLSKGQSRSPAAAPFQRPLPIPPVLTPVRTDSTTDYYEVTQRETQLEILPSRFDFLIFFQCFSTARFVEVSGRGQSTQIPPQNRVRVVRHCSVKQD